MTAALAEKETAAEWKTICALEDIPRLGSRVVESAAGDIAVFRTADDAVFALHDKCPHKGGPLSQGIVHGRQVSCPLHGWKIGLEDGQAAAPDSGRCGRFEVKVENGMVRLAVQDPPRPTTFESKGESKWLT
jgi:nitrite reductase (NADH) small subunit